MHRVIRINLAAISASTLLVVSAAASTARDQTELLKARETVWRAWFANDAKTLEQLVPPGSIVISAGEEKWKNQKDILQSSTEFHAAGGKLIRLEFPRTEIQHFGKVAFVFSQYLLETEMDGKRSTSSGRVTEIFVLRHGKWVNPGWHTDAGK